MCDAIRSKDFRVTKSDPKRTKRDSLIIELSKTLDLNASFMKSVQAVSPTTGGGYRPPLTQTLVRFVRTCN
jgi:hypothetical protein